MVIIWSIVQAIFVRCLLFIHSFLCIWRAVDVQKSHLFWLLGCGNILHIVEIEHRILKKRGQEDKWFCLCFFIHLVNTVPAIWLLEFDRLERYQYTSTAPTGNSTNVTTNSTSTVEDDESLSPLEGITLPVKLDADTWASVLEQGFLFILILGRWILPRGKLTRDQLSQLLFVYIGSGSDVMELFIIFEEPEIRRDKVFSYAILAVWSLSLLQFTLVLTSTRKPRGGTTVMNVDPRDETDYSYSNMPARCCAKMVEMEIWSLFVAMILQDGPYLAIRMCAIFVKNVLSYGILFFASKNILMLMMLLYRCLVVGTHHDELEEKHKEKVENKEKEEIKRTKSQNDDRVEEHRKRSPEGRQDKMLRKYPRWSSESPPNYWSHPDYRFPGTYGIGHPSYGYNYY